MATRFRIALVAGEESGDILGADLMANLQLLLGDVEFIGIGGERMQRRGLVSLFPLDRLSVMGLIEPLKRLPELVRMRRSLHRRFAALPVDLFIGIDSPDFNLGLARGLRKRGIATAHYVSPSVWAWRQKRILGIKKSIDLMLTLLPFEADFYRKHDVPVEFVGHPLATTLHANSTKSASREALRLSDQPLVALLPGSRGGEVKHIMPVLLETVRRMQQAGFAGQFAVAAANHHRAAQIRHLIGENSDLPVVTARTHELVRAADLVVVASGTATLETLLLNRAMVIVYRSDPISYRLISAMLRVPFVGLPNLLAGRQLVPELLQDGFTAEALDREIRSGLQDSQAREDLLREFERIATQLRLPSSEIAARALIKLLPTPT